MAERITPQQIELITELLQNQKIPPPNDLKDYSVKQAINLISDLQRRNYSPLNMNMGGFDYTPNFNY